MNNATQSMLQYPDFHGAAGDMLEAGSVAEIAVAAERAGFSGPAFTEHPAQSGRWLAVPDGAGCTTWR